VGSRVLLTSLADDATRAAVITFFGALATAAGVATWKLSGRVSARIGRKMRSGFREEVREVVIEEIEPIRQDLRDHMAAEEQRGSETAAAQRAQAETLGVLVGRFDAYEAENERTRAGLVDRNDHDHAEFRDALRALGWTPKEES